VLLAIGSTAMAASAAKKVSIIFADFSERSGLLFFAKDQGFFAGQGLDADIVQVRSGLVAISANEKTRGLRAEDLIDDRTVRRLEQKGLFQASPR
jgi:hypothetical protein